MELKVIREYKDNLRTIGSLYIDGVKFCDTLEDIDRKLKQQDTIASIQATKVYSKTAIPTGIYDVIVDYSNRFKKNMPHIINVPGFEGIRIHSGNTEEDTDGCILLGTRDGNLVANSRVAYDKFILILINTLKKDKVNITIV